jgi:hypothetical protein
MKNMEIRQLELFKDAPITTHPAVLEFEQIINECKAIAKVYWHSKPKDKKVHV